MYRVCCKILLIPSILSLRINQQACHVAVDMGSYLCPFLPSSSWILYTGHAEYNIIFALLRGSVK